jgi:hypothetical protein
MKTSFRHLGLPRKGAKSAGAESRRRGVTDWNYLWRMTDQDAVRGALGDPDNQPTDEAFWTDPRVRVVLPPTE